MVIPTFNFQIFFILVEGIFGKRKRVKNLFDPDTFLSHPLSPPLHEMERGTYGGEVKKSFVRERG